MAESERDVDSVIIEPVGELPSDASLGDKGGLSNDKRDRRIAHAHLYKAGVAAWRTANPSVQAETEPASTRARVYVRVRPLFEHEALRGEWSCVSIGDGVTLHEGIERVQSGKGVVKALRHHTFAAARPLADNDAVVSGMGLDLVSEAVAGGVATLFMLGMTGSGKTYNMDVIHRAVPAELFAALASPTATNGQAAQQQLPQPPVCGPTVGLIAYELIGKKSFDLLSPEKGEVMLRAGADGKVHVSGTVERVASRPAELVDWLREASARRETAATGDQSAPGSKHPRSGLDASSIE